ncbi:MAG: MFS transporter [Bacteroidales bacterium]|nr:MFS transporter [Bacteroidales bacterium]
MDKKSNKVTFTILSLSLLTVMAGAAMAPALGVIKEHFSSYDDMLIQLIVSLPSFFIIITNLCFPVICKYFKTKTIAFTGLLIYTLAGSLAFFVSDIYVILLLRAILGISVGMIMPLSTGLLSFYFPPEEQARLMGLSAAMSQLGGVIATLLAGLLANISWNCAFLVYLLGLISLVSVALFLPSEKLEVKGRISVKHLKRFHPSVIGMLLLMCIFFIFPTNFAITSSNTDKFRLSPNEITLIMVGLDVVASLVGLVFGFFMAKIPKKVKYLAPVLFLLGYLSYTLADGSMLLIIGSVLIGLANGIGIPYLNTIASVKGGKEAATTVMPLISASLYLGQFISPLIVRPLSKIFFSQNDITSPYKIGVILCIIFLIQMYLTRNQQALPPNEAKNK